MNITTPRFSLSPRASLISLLTVALLLVGMTSSAFAERTIKIACYNMENYFDVYDDPYVGDETTDPKFDFEIEKLAAAIRQMDADVIGICEVENAEVIKAMVEIFLPDMGYNYITVEKTNDGRGINLGVISRFPIVKATSYRFQTLTLPNDNRKWRFARDLAHFTIDLGEDIEEDLELFSVHFKSKRDSENDPQSGLWRLAEARRSAEIIRSIIANNPDSLVAMVGDFNDTRDSPPIKTLAKNSGENKAAPLFDVHYHLSAEERISYLKGQFRSQIDYILTSPALTKGYVKGSAGMINTGEIIKGSDHAPVYASFKVE